MKVDYVPFLWHEWLAYSSYATSFTPFFITFPSPESIAGSSSPLLLPKIQEHHVFLQPHACLRSKKQASQTTLSTLRNDQPRVPQSPKHQERDELFPNPKPLVKLRCRVSPGRLPTSLDWSCEVVRRQQMLQVIVSYCCPRLDFLIRTECLVGVTGSWIWGLGLCG